MSDLSILVPFLKQYMSYKEVSILLREEDQVECECISEILVKAYLNFSHIPFDLYHKDDQSKEKKEKRLSKLSRTDSRDCKQLVSLTPKLKDKVPEQTDDLILSISSCSFWKLATLNTDPFFPAISLRVSVFIFSPIPTTTM